MLLLTAQGPTETQAPATKAPSCELPLTGFLNNSIAFAYDVPTWEDCGNLKTTLFCLLCITGVRFFQRNSFSWTYSTLKMQFYFRGKLKSYVQVLDVESFQNQ